jgi:hypothetical protein
MLVFKTKGCLKFKFTPKDDKTWAEKATENFTNHRSRPTDYHKSEKNVSLQANVSANRQI